MPTFTSRSPSVSQGIAAFLGSSPDLRAKDYLDVERAVSTIEHQRAQSEKIRQEIEAEKQMAAARADPQKAAEFAALQSGGTVADVERVLRNVRQQPEILAPDVAGPPAPVTPVSDIPEARRIGIGSSLAATVANQLTSKNKADDLAHAQALAQAARLGQEASVAGTPIPVQNQLNAAARPGQQQTPFRINEPGVVIDQSTGTLNEQGLLAQEVRKRVAAQAGLAQTRGSDIVATQPSRIARNQRVTGGRNFAPHQIQSAIDLSIKREFDMQNKAVDDYEKLGAKAQKTRTRPSAPDLVAIRRTVEARYKAGTEGPEAERVRALNALAGGGDPVIVKQIFKDKTGLDLSDADMAAAKPAAP